MSGDETHRLFIALVVPEEVKKELQRVQSELRERLREETVRWTPPAQMHLTLKFLGNVSSKRLDDLIECVRLACNCAPPLELTAAGIGFFPNARRRRVIWAGIVNKGNKLEQLQQRVEANTAVFACTIEEKTFAAHLTIARIKEITTKDARALELAALEMTGREFGTWRAASVEIIRSELGSAGSRYSRIAQIHLTPETI